MHDDIPHAIDDPEPLQPAGVAAPPPVPSTPRLGPFAGLLGDREATARRLAGSREPLRWLAGAALAFAFYGAAAGAFGGLPEMTLAALKAPLVVLASIALCIPSLWVLAALAGAELSARRFFGSLAGLYAVLALLLVAFLPVAWLFSVSSRSLAFVTTFHVLFWLLALGLGHRFLRDLWRETPVPLGRWFLLLFVVSLQVTTQLRPLLDTSGGELFEPGRLSFVEHFARTFDTESPGPAGED